MASFKSCNLLTITTMSTLAGNFTYWMPLYTFSSEYGQSLPKILYSLNGLNRLPTTSICSWISIKHNKSLEWVQVSISKLQDIKLRHSSRGKKHVLHSIRNHLHLLSLFMWNLNTWKFHLLTTTRIKNEITSQQDNISYSRNLWGT